MSKKTCTKCGKTKSEENFYFKNKALGKRSASCKACDSEADRLRAKKPPEQQDVFKVPAKPFREWIIDNEEKTHGFVGKLSEKMGIDSRRFRTIKYGYYIHQGKKYPVKNIDVDFVERALHAEGMILSDVYPDV